MVRNLYEKFDEAHGSIVDSNRGQEDAMSEEHFQRIVPPSWLEIEKQRYLEQLGPYG